MTTRSRFLGLLGFVVVCLAVGGLGAVATTPQIEGWYRTLDKPTWTPPGRVFGPVWTMLYLLMAVAAWLVWQPGGFRTAKLPLGLFGIQLLLNLAWSWIFFGFHQLAWAFVDIMLLWVAIVGTLSAFGKYSRLAAALLVPYLLWVSFAAILNYAIWQRNV